MDTISEQRLSQVWPTLAEKIHAMAQTLQSNGVVIRVVQGLRTYVEQDALYAQGRSAPGKIVTNVRGGYSWHNFGLAVDCVPSINGINQEYAPDWNNTHVAWQMMEEQGRALGLTCGADWSGFPDYPHFQLTGQYPMNAPNDTVRQMVSSQGLEAFWSTITI